VKAARGECDKEWGGFEMGKFNGASPHVALIIARHARVLGVLRAF